MSTAMPDAPEVRYRIVSVDGADVVVVDLDVVVTCSSGTYVRALARDVGAALGTVIAQATTHAIERR